MNSQGGLAFLNKGETLLLLHMLIAVAIGDVRQAYAERPAGLQLHLRVS